MSTPALDLTKLEMPVVFRWKEPMMDDELLDFARQIDRPVAGFELALHRLGKALSCPEQDAEEDQRG